MENDNVSKGQLVPRFHIFHWEDQQILFKIRASRNNNLNLLSNDISQKRNEILAHSFSHMY